MHRCSRRPPAAELAPPPVRHRARHPTDCASGGAACAARDAAAPNHLPSDRPRNPPAPAQRHRRSGPDARRPSRTLPGGPASSPSRSRRDGSVGRRQAAREGSSASGELRPTIRCAPCGAAQLRWPARHGCACATGTRESSRGDGCSAGTCACPCSRLSFSRCSLLGSHCAGRSCSVSQLLRVAALGLRASAIPCRHRRHCFERVPHGAQPERVVARAHKSTRRWAGDLASLSGGDRRRQNERLPSL